MSEHVTEPDDSGIVVFDSLEAACDFMTTSEMAANARLTPGQIALRDDMGHTRYWVRALPEMDLVVYGRAETAGFLQASGVGFDPTENRERGYLTGTAYSAWEPAGEYGDTHVADVIPISESVFRMAEGLGWPTFSMLHDPEMRPLAVALAVAEREALG